MVMPTSGEEPSNRGNDKCSLRQEQARGVWAKSRGLWGWSGVSAGKSSGRLWARDFDFDPKWSGSHWQVRAGLTWSDLVWTGCCWWLRLDEDGFVRRTGSVPRRAWVGRWGACCTAWAAEECDDGLCRHQLLLLPGHSWLSVSWEPPSSTHTAGFRLNTPYCLRAEPPPPGSPSYRRAPGDIHVLYFVPTMQYALRKAPHPPSASVSPSILKQSFIIPIHFVKYLEG